MASFSLDLLSTPAGATALWLLMPCLMVASLTDLARRKIPNWLTLSASLAAFALHATLGGGAGFAASLCGFLIWFTAGFTFYRCVGGIGAGDIKLLMACSALVGALPTLHIAFISFALQLLWLLFCWALRGELVANLRAMAAWLYVTIMPRTKKLHFVAVGTQDRSPHAPFVLAAAVLVLLAR